MAGCGAFVRRHGRGRHAASEGAQRRDIRALEPRLKGLANCTVYEGHARFESADSILVNGELLSAERIFLKIEVGSRLGWAYVWTSNISTARIPIGSSSAQNDR